MGCIGSSGIATAVCDPASTQKSAELSRSVSNHWPEHSQQRQSGEPRGQSFHDEHELLRKVGKGSFASVYLTRKVYSEQQEEAAVKVIDLRDKQPGSQVSERRIQAVWREVEIMQRLKGTTQVVQVLDAYMENGLAYVVMEKCDLSLLQALERSSKLREVTIRSALRQMLQGLAAVHAAGIAHRDIKPDNFLSVGPRGAIKLCDFGLSRALPAPEDEEEGLGGVYGTPPFMAPEMLSGTPYGTSVDIWSFGVIAFVLFYGTFPYLPWERSAAAMKQAILEGTPEPVFRPAPALEASGVTISEPSTELLQQVLCRDPQQRPTAAALLEGGLLDARAGGGVAGEQQASLWPVLQAAKALGAFDSQGGKHLSERSDIDDRLDTLQAQRHGTLLHRNIRRARCAAADWKQGACAKVMHRSGSMAQVAQHATSAVF